MKAYVKPELFYERYELSKHIADCAWELNNGNTEVCHMYNGDSGKNLGDFTLFSSDLGCNLTEEDTEMYCYQAGPEGKNTFCS